MIPSNIFERNVCDRCLTISSHEQCPGCGHTHLRKIIINLQDGRMNGTNNPQ